MRIILYLSLLFMVEAFRITPRYSHGSTYNSLKILKCDPRDSVIMNSKIKIKQDDMNGGFQDINMIEKEIIENTRAKIDFKRVTDAIFEDSDGANDDTKLLLGSKNNRHSNQIALTAALTTAFASFLVFQNYILSIVSFVLTYFIALGDPLEEDNIIGSLVRILGRSALSVISSIKPRIKSILRVSIKGDDELLELRQQIQTLQEENKSLRTLLLKKETIENDLPKYTLDQLKELCRKNDISGYSGLTKEKLLTKLVDEGIIQL